MRGLVWYGSSDDLYGMYAFIKVNWWALLSQSVTTALTIEHACCTFELLLLSPGADFMGRNIVRLLMLIEVVKVAASQARATGPHLHLLQALAALYHLLHGGLRGRASSLLIQDWSSAAVVLLKQFRVCPSVFLPHVHPGTCASLPFFKFKLFLLGS